MTHPKVVILGAGNVAFHMTKALLNNTVNLLQIFNKTLSKAQELATSYNVPFTDKISEIEQADLYIICTSDRAIEEASFHIPFENSLVVHTSGSIPVSALKGKYGKGVLYPLHTFSKKRSLEYDRIPFFIEAESPSDEEFLENFAKKISKEVYVVNYEKRLKIHMAAIWANNFTNHMYYLAGEICKQQDIPFNILKPLIKETVDKIEDGFTPFDAQTGPAKRGDAVIIDKHLQLLSYNFDLQQLYSLISNSITNTYHNNDDKL